MHSYLYSKAPFSAVCDLVFGFGTACGRWRFAAMCIQLHHGPSAGGVHSMETCI